MRKTLHQALKAEPLQPAAAFSEFVDEALDRLPARNTQSIRPHSRLAMGLCAALVLCALPFGYRALAPNGNPLAQPDPVTSPEPEQDPRSSADLLKTGEHVVLFEDGKLVSMGSYPEQVPFEQLSAGVAPMPQVTEPDDAVRIPTVTDPDEALTIPTLPPAPEQSTKDPDYALRFQLAALYHADGTVVMPFSAPLGDRNLELIGLYAQFGQLKFEVATDDGQSVADLKLRQVYLNGEPVTARFPIGGKAAEAGAFTIDAAGKQHQVYPMVFTCIAPEVDYFKNGGRHLISAVFEQNGQAAVLSANVNVRSGKSVGAVFEEGANFYGLHALAQMFEENCADYSQADVVHYPVPQDEGGADNFNVISMEHHWGRIGVTVRMPAGRAATDGRLALNEETLYLLDITPGDENTLWTLNFFTDAKPGAFDGANVDITAKSGPGEGYGAAYPMSPPTLAEYARQAWKMDYQGMLDTESAFAGRIFACKGRIVNQILHEGARTLVMDVAEDGAAEAQHCLLVNQITGTEPQIGDTCTAFAEFVGLAEYQGRSCPKLVCRYVTP